MVFENIDHLLGFHLSLGSCNFKRSVALVYLSNVNKMGEGALSELFEQADFVENALAEDLFSILETLEDAINSDGLVSGLLDTKVEEDTIYKAAKKWKLSALDTGGVQDGLQKTSHITVERNRRKQMNEHLSVLNSLMPCFYAKREDQASIIGGVVDYIRELQQVLQPLEAKKQRKAYSEVLSPCSVSSPRPSLLSPRPSLLSPRMVSGLLISPRMPQPGSPYMPRMQQQSYLSPTLQAAPSSPSFSNTGGGATSELVANSKSVVAEVEVKFSGPNVILKTMSHRIPGQVVKIIVALEGLALEILHVISAAFSSPLTPPPLGFAPIVTSRLPRSCFTNSRLMRTFSYGLAPSSTRPRHRRRRREGATARRSLMTRLQIESSSSNIVALGSLQALVRRCWCASSTRSSAPRHATRRGRRPRRRLR
ncbi:transcription factor SPEECHLESS [Canna indica]|uniref:Transcription factor SPEECHLESS n=1 Tax=Canna indica TaxID=4628 RepID=A0AAQ3QT96_9LILI|nr:transcription factor SPEECHLESS [Canna indica]